MLLASLASSQQAIRATLDHASNKLLQHSLVFRDMRTNFLTTTMERSHVCIPHADQTMRLAQHACCLVCCFCSLLMATAANMCSKV